MDESLSDRDKKYIWHPYTQHKHLKLPIPIVKAKGSLLYDEKGRTYIDAISSWWVTLHGHSHPYIAEKIYQQALQLEQVIFTGFTHRPAVELAERLIPLLPGSFSKIFYSDNGSTAVEVALKMAIQYWGNKDIKRTKIIVLENSYHGDTFGTMSVSSRSVFTRAFSEFLFEVISIPAPSVSNFSLIQQQLEPLIKDAAAFIYEPLLQGSAGMLMHDSAALDQLLAYMRTHEVLCIADEVLTGFGRTGTLFAGDRLHEKADIICLSKGLTGGTMALGVTACTEQIFNAYLSDDRAKTFFHGHSFTANPLACTAALASLDLLLKEECVQRIAFITSRHQEFAGLLNSYPAALNTRCLGTVLAFELDNAKNNYLHSAGPQITAAMIEKGVYIRPLGNTVYIMPPYCMEAEELEQVYSAILTLF